MIFAFFIIQSISYNALVEKLGSSDGTGIQEPYDDGFVAAEVGLFGGAPPYGFTKPPAGGRFLCD